MKEYFKIILVAGARPNFMKIAPILRAIKMYNSQKYSRDITTIEAILVHTGQHYDQKMSHIFFKDLGIKKPDFNLEVGSNTHAKQTADIMIKFENICTQIKPDLVMVVGDVNSTIAASLVAKKLHIILAHIEAGLRSNDRNMPEEINRITTDAISDIFFVTEEDGINNLLKEGHTKKRIHMVGNVMIDNLLYQLDKVNRGEVSNNIKELKSRLPKQYIVMTLHRPSNVDDRTNLANILNSIQKISKIHKIPIIFSCHPRTWKNIKRFNLANYLNNMINSNKDINSEIYKTEPLNYNDFLFLWKDAKCVLTDSGGIQEETTALGIPCITLRKNTERPVTCIKGTNILIGNNTDKLNSIINDILKNIYKKGSIPKFWDGRASEKIISIIINKYIK